MTLPIRDMVLYKHGVGFFARQGEVSGESVSLIFKHDEINDILKSLAVFDRAGGQILGIHYQTPKDYNAQLNDSSIKLSSDASLYDLIRDLRGRRVTVTVADEAQIVLTGRVIGLDVKGDEREEHRFTLLDDSGTVHVVSSEHLTKLEINDEQSAHDLAYFLDTSLTEENRRTIHLRLSAGEHDLVVYFVAPSPTWRVSYRLVAETNEDSTTGKAVLQGWGLFDNRFDEDLENVNVTLVAGQPISFIYDLYSSEIPSRKFIKDKSREAVDPMFFGGAVMATAMEEDSDEIWLEDRVSPKRARAITAAGAPMPAQAYAPKMEAAMGTMQAVTETSESQETFQYRVTTPVTVKRGESALVPIISKEVNYTRELLYNSAKLKDHPVAALRFENNTGLTLEYGPVTLVEDGQYRGEAILDFTKPDKGVYLPYAVELGVRVKVEQNQRMQTTGLNIEGQYFVFDDYFIQEITTIFENTTSNDVLVTLETAKLQDHELFETRAPDSETLSEFRWQVNVSKQGSTKFVHKLRRLHRRHQEIRTFNYRQLESFMANRWLDQSTFARLEGLLNLLGDVQKAKESIAQHKTERQELYDRQAQLRENLGALGAGESDTGFRNRLLKQLEESQDQLDAIDGQIATLKAQIDDNEAQVSRFLGELN